MQYSILKDNNDLLEPNVNFLKNQFGLTDKLINKMNNNIKEYIDVFFKKTNVDFNDSKSKSNYIESFSNGLNDIFLTNLADIIQKIDNYDKTRNLILNPKVFNDFYSKVIDIAETTYSKYIIDKISMISNDLSNNSNHKLYLKDEKEKINLILSSKINIGEIDNNIKFEKYYSTILSSLGNEHYEALKNKKDYYLAFYTYTRGNKLLGNKSFAKDLEFNQTYFNLNDEIVKVDGIYDSLDDFLNHNIDLKKINDNYNNAKNILINQGKINGIKYKIVTENSQVYTYFSDFNDNIYKIKGECKVTSKNFAKLKNGSCQIDPLKSTDSSKFIKGINNTYVGFDADLFINLSLKNINNKIKSFKKYNENKLTNIEKEKLLITLKDNYQMLKYGTLLKCDQYSKFRFIKRYFIKHKLTSIKKEIKNTFNVDDKLFSKILEKDIVNENLLDGSKFKDLISSNIEKMKTTINNGVFDLNLHSINDKDKLNDKDKVNNKDKVNDKDKLNDKDKVNNKDKVNDKDKLNDKDKVNDKDKLNNKNLIFTKDELNVDLNKIETKDFINGIDSIEKQDDEFYDEELDDLIDVKTNDYEKINNEENIRHVVVNFRKNINYRY